jgi:hypothetical protein
MMKNRGKIRPKTNRLIRAADNRPLLSTHDTMIDERQFSARWLCSRTVVGHGLSRQHGSSQERTAAIIAA